MSSNFFAVSNYVFFKVHKGPMVFLWLLARKLGSLYQVKYNININSGCEGQPLISAVIFCWTNAIMLVEQKLAYFPPCMVLLTVLKFLLEMDSQYWLIQLNYICGTAHAFSMHLFFWYSSDQLCYLQHFHL